MFHDNDDGTYSLTKRFWLQVIIIGLLIVAIGLNTQRAYNRTERLNNELTALTNQTAHCMSELLTTINARSAITTENDKLSVEQRDALATANNAQNDWIASLLNPPRDIAVLPVNDQRRSDWGLMVTQEYFAKASVISKTISDSRTKQASLIKTRENHPFPEPDCALVRPPK